MKCLAKSLSASAPAAYPPYAPLGIDARCLAGKVWRAPRDGWWAALVAKPTMGFPSLPLREQVRNNLPVPRSDLGNIRRGTVLLVATAGSDANCPCTTLAGEPGRRLPANVETRDRRQESAANAPNDPTDQKIVAGGQCCVRWSLWARAERADAKPCAAAIAGWFLFLARPAAGRRSYGRRIREPDSLVRHAGREAGLQEGMR